MFKIITEMAEELREIGRDLKSKNEIVIEHLLMIYLYPNSKHINHWEREVRSFIDKVSKVKSKNKYPTQKQILNFTWFIFEDVLIERFNVYVDDIEYKENKVKEIDNPDPQVFYNFVKEYFYWLSDKLSIKGYIERQETINKIEELRKNLY